MAKANKSYKSKGDKVLEVIARAIVSGTGGNPFFVTLAALVIIVTDKLDNFSAKLLPALNGSRTQRLAKNEARAELIVVLDTLCDAVNDIAKGNAEIVSSSEFPMGSGTPGQATMGPLKKFTITNGPNPNTIVILTVKGPNTVSVMVEYVVTEELTPLTVWNRCNSTTQLCTLTNLPSAKRIYARATSVGRRGQILFTEPIRTVII